jgi:hypothetical protein
MVRILVSVDNKLIELDTPQIPRRGDRLEVQGVPRRAFVEHVTWAFSSGPPVVTLTVSVDDPFARS